ncbi:MAG: hypothetical protein AAGK00_05710 [Pseudomonadota bacterium]
MTTKKLENDRDSLLDGLFRAQHALLVALQGQTDPGKRAEINAELDRVMGLIDEIIDADIKQLTDDFIADPQVQADVKQIRDATKEVKKVAAELEAKKKDLEKIKKAIDKIIKPLEKLAKFVA